MASILIVDDEVDYRDALARCLKAAGHRVRCASDGRQALEAIRHDAPDVVILDALMPEMDGISFLETMRCYLRWTEIPVFLVTGHAQGLHIRRGMELGVRKTFLKSDFELSELLAYVDACSPSTPSQGMDDSMPPSGRLN